jgi:HSP20 family protein
MEARKKEVAMSALMPRLFGDMADWFEFDLPLRANLIRVEDLMTEREYKVRAELPGLDPEKDVQITVNNGVLTIRAERKEETQARHRSEFRYGSLQRSVRLPVNADEENVTAKYGTGILEVTVPLKTADSTTKQIPVSTSE